MSAEQKKEEIKKWISNVHTELRKLLSLYEETDCFNTVPKGEAEEDPVDFTSRKIEEIRNMVKQKAAELSEITPDAIHGTSPKVHETAHKLEQIINETAYFLQQYEVPGVVDRWKTINPQITYFDCVFDMMEECPELYQKSKMEMSKPSFSFYPDEDLVAKRKSYFEKIKERIEKENLNWSEERIFQEELLNTLKLLFENEFKEYLQE